MYHADSFEYPPKGDLNKESISDLYDYFTIQSQSNTKDAIVKGMNIMSLLVW